MTPAPDHPAPATAALWLPPQRLRRYLWAKLAVAVLIGAIFAGWLVIQWSSPAMRLLASALLLITLWVLVSSIVSDRRRARGRQLAVEPDALVITQPTGTTRVPLAAIASAAWRDEPAEDAGLTLYDGHGRVLAQLDANLLADEAEARAFLGWARRHAPLNFPVRWE